MTCVTCVPPQPVGARRLLDHVRLFHPDMYDGVECWPDGAHVIVDTTLQPEDFTRPEG